MHVRYLGLTTAFALMVFLTNAAQADAIDGDWCRADGKRMSIRGPSIMTPGGKAIEGNYSHSISYVVPAGETGAGTTTEIQLLSEYLAQARTAGDASVQEWRRCQPGVS
jgi:hypothetical protein